MGVSEEVDSRDGCTFLTEALGCIPVLAYPANKPIHGWHVQLAPGVAALPDQQPYVVDWSEAGLVLHGELDACKQRQVAM